MSSFIGHTLTSLGVYATTQSPQKPAWRDLLWLGWLTFVALAPDLDYVIPALYALRASMEDGLRVTHSLVGCLVFPLLTLPVLMRLKLTQETRRRYVIQVFLAGLSHIVLDMLVGVWPLPLLWPFTSRRFALPFGILPSAPSFRLDNPYMYRNLLMEVGILIPLYAGVYLLRFGKGAGWKRYGSIAVLWLCSVGFMGWAFTLAR
ncbi:MAG TPA: metal-dependent hydrolase [Anaerolineae bacterium]|nr:metal-dependent hydrolase [Anaerolineae bacterium]